MRFAPIAMVAIGLAVAAPALAADKVSDVEYIQAARCLGIAKGLSADATALEAFVKTAGRTRLSYIQMRADEEQARGKRDAKSSARTERAAAELSGTCQAYKG